MLRGLTVLTLKGEKLVFMSNFHPKPPDHPLLKFLTVDWDKVAVAASEGDLGQEEWTAAPACHSWQVARFDNGLILVQHLLSASRHPMNVKQK